MLLGLFNLSQAQTTSWNWITQTEGAGGETSQGAVLDSQGNVYHAGIFAGNFILEGDTVQSWGGLTAASAYVSRYTPGGPAANNWSFVIGSKTNNSIISNIQGLKVDAAGNTSFYYYEFNLNFGPDTIQIGPNDYILKGMPPGDVSILVNLDPQGNVLWFKFFEPGFTTGAAHPIHTAFNLQGELYIIGRIGQQSPATLILDSITINAIGSSGHFLAKADLNGKFIWAKSFGCKGDNGKSLQIEVNDQDEIFVSGSWDGDTFFMDGLTTINPTPGGGYDRYIAKFNSNGQAQWLVNEGGQAQELSASLAPKASGGVMCLSQLNPTANLLLNNGTISLSPPGVVLTQYDSQGNFESSIQYPINSSINQLSQYNGCVLSGDGTDFFMSTLYSAPSQNLGTLVLNNAGGNLGTQDAIIAKIDTAGAILWAESIGSDGDEEIFSLDYSAITGLTIGGSTSSSQVIFGSDTLVNAGFLTNEAFVANLSIIGIGLSELPKIETISLYPNPSSGQLFFNLEESESEHITLKVQNLTGQIVLEKTLDTENAEQILDVQELNPGLYLINIADGIKTFSGKFIKQ